MTNAILRGVVAAALAAFAPLASAHEFTCSALAGILTPRQDGLPVTTSEGMPVPVGALQPALTVSSYPANIGVQVTLRNVASEPSVITGSWDTLDSTGGAPAMQFPLPPVGAGQTAPPFAAGTTLPVGGSVVGWFAYQVQNQQECLHAFGGQAEPAVCTNDETDFRFVVTHDVGSTECRARVVCAAAEGQPPAAGPVRAPACPPMWHGVKESGRRSYADAIALGPVCTVSVVGQTLDATLVDTPAPAFLETFDASAVSQGLEVWGQIAAASAVAVDLAGNRWIAWANSTPIPGGTGTRYSPWIGKFDANGVLLWSEHPDPIAGGQGIYGTNQVHALAVDTAGNAYAVGENLESQLQAVKFGPDGSVVWAQAVGAGLGRADGTGVAVDAAGDVLVVGPTSSTDFTRQGSFVAKLEPNGIVLWATFLPTPSGWEAVSTSALAVDAAGDAFVGGWVFRNSNTTAFESAAYVAKLDPQGRVLWSGQLPSPARVSAVATDSSGNVWATGSEFVAKYDSSGNLQFLDTLGTLGLGGAAGIAVDANGDAFVAGSMNFGTFGNLDGVEAWVAKFDPAGNLQ